MDNNAIKKRVVLVVHDLLLTEDITSDSDLLEEGFLDSFTLINLMAALEQEFELEFEPEDLEIEDYRTLDSITAMVSKVQQTCH